MVCIQKVANGLNIGDAEEGTGQQDSNGRQNDKRRAESGQHVSPAPNVALELTKRVCRSLVQQLEALEALNDELAHPRVNAVQVCPSRARPPQLLPPQRRVFDFTGAGRLGHA